MKWINREFDTQKLYCWFTDIHFGWIHTGDEKKNEWENANSELSSEKKTLASYVSVL